MEEQPAQPISIEGDGGTIIVNGPDMAAGPSGNSAALLDDRPGVSGVHLLLMCLDTERHVTFHEGVIDNEGMDRRKSKCCCIYRKPHVFGESSSSSDDECEHCCGHPEVRLRNRLKKQQQARLCSCCCHHHCQGQQAAPSHEEPATDIAGDSGSVLAKPKPEQPVQPLVLMSVNSKAVQN